MLPGIDEVYAGTAWLTRLSKISAFFITISIILLIGLFIAISYVIFQTIRLIINSRKDLIEILDLVGATKSTIEIPYLINGTLYGFIGGLLAAISLKLSLMGIEALFSYHLPSFWFIYPLLVLIGLVIGLIGSYLSFEEILP
jgi:cell division transport system permease protein